MSRSRWRRNACEPLQLGRVPVPRIAQRQDVVLVEVLADRREAVVGEAVEGLRRPRPATSFSWLPYFCPQPVAESLPATCWRSVGLAFSGAIDV